MEKRHWDEKLVKLILRTDMKISRWQFPLLMFGSISSIYVLPTNPTSITDFSLSFTIIVLIVLAASTLTHKRDKG